MAKLVTKLLRHKLILGALLMVVIVLAGIASAFFSVESNPEKALQHFYENGGPEETLMDPLILSGNKVVPLVIEKIKDKKMPRRRYAIAFLGNGSYPQALPGLQNILQDSSELDYFRSDALHSIYQIDAELGLKYAKSYKNESNFLGSVSQDLLSEKRLAPDGRTYLQAVLTTVVN